MQYCHRLFHILSYKSFAEVIKIEIFKQLWYSPHFRLDCRISMKPSKMTNLLLASIPSVPLLSHGNLACKSTEP